MNRANGMNSISIRFMFRSIFWLGVMLAGLSVLSYAKTAFGFQDHQNASRSEATVLTLKGAVTPTAADYLSREIIAASAAKKELIILEIDTPGGLVTAMESIIKTILDSGVPIATYVSPQGAKSASAGLYIMYAAHISAMAPATNTGSATPVQIGGNDSGQGPALEPIEPQLDKENTSDFAPIDREIIREAIDDVTQPRDEPVASPSGSAQNSRPLSSREALRAKIINNSVAYIRSLAELRGRNADWAEKAVRDAANVTASEALRLNVIDLIADDMDDLLLKIDGRKVEVKGEIFEINTKNIFVNRIEPTTAERVLAFFADPNVAAILMSIGMLGITVEFWNPGSIFPGALGFACLMLGLYAAQTLPFRSLGAALMIGGFVLILIEAYTPTFGVAGLLGLGLFAAGLYLLFPETLRVSGSVIAMIIGFAGAFLALILFAFVSSRAGGPLLGGDAIRRREGYVDEWHGTEGYVIVEGERWQARSKEPLVPGDKIKVSDVEGLVLVVRKAKSSADASSLLSRMPVNHKSQT